MLLSYKFLEVRDNLTWIRTRSAGLSLFVLSPGGSTLWCRVSKCMTHILSSSAPRADITKWSWHSFLCSPVKASESPPSAFLEATTNLSELTGLIKPIFWLSLNGWKEGLWNWTDLNSSPNTTTYLLCDSENSCPSALNINFPHCQIFPPLLQRPIVMHFLLWETSIHKKLCVPASPRPQKTP